MKRALVALIIVALPLAAGAQTGGPALKVVPDRTRLEVGERFWVSVILEGNNAQYKGPFPIPDLSPYLRLVHTTDLSSQRSIQIINGLKIQSASFHSRYQFEAGQVGLIEFPAISYRVGKTLIKSKPFKLEIVPPKSFGDPSKSSGWSPPTDPYLDLVLSKEEVYVGEQVIASWYIYYKENIHEFEWPPFRPPSEFTIADLGSATSLGRSNKMVGGKPWFVDFLHSEALYPNKAGALKVEPIKCRYAKRAKGRRSWGFMIQENVVSPSRTVKVKPLPDEGRPDDFTGAVGRFNIQLSQARTKIKANQQFNFTLTVIGTGHPDFIPKPEISLPKGFDLYTEDAQSEVNQERGTAIGIRRFKLIIVPHLPGDYDLAPFHFSYFDPEEQRYKTARSKRIKLKVEPGDDDDGIPLAVISSPQTLTGTANSRFIKLDSAPTLSRSGLLLGSRAALIAQLMPLILVAVALGVRKRRDRLFGDVAYARRIRAAKSSLKTLTKAEKTAEAGDAARACSLIHRALAGYVADCSNLPAQGMTTADALAALRDLGAPESVIVRAKEIFDRLDMARFAPGASGRESLSEVIGKVRELIASLEKGNGG